MASRWLCLVLVLVAITASSKAADNPGVRALLRVYDECSTANSFGACLKKKALVFVDRLARMDRLNVAEGFTVVRSSDAAPPAAPASDDDIEKNLPRDLEARDVALTDMLMTKAADYVSSRTLQVTLPEMTGRELSRGMEEGRGKMKKMMGMMMMGMAAKMAGMIPLAIGALFLMAGKALMMAKIALLLALIIALKKLIAAKSGGHGHGGHGQVWHSSGGGWDKRSYEEAQKMAYKAYVPSQ